MKGTGGERHYKVGISGSHRPEPAGIGSSVSERPVISHGIGKADRKAEGQNRGYIYNRICADVTLDSSVGYQALFILDEKQLL